MKRESDSYGKSNALERKLTFQSYLILSKNNYQFINS
jgi:hypothetical protein